MAQGSDAGAAKAEKAIREAEKGLTRLSAELTKVITLLKQDKFTQKKAKVASAKAISAVKKHKPVTKLKAAKDFSDLPDDLQAQVEWIDALVNDLLTKAEALPASVKLMKKSPEGDAKLLQKKTKPMAMDVKQAPKFLGVIVKEAKKGIDSAGPNGQLINLMPMILQLYGISDAITRGLRAKP